MALSRLFQFCGLVAWLSSFTGIAHGQQDLRGSWAFYAEIGGPGAGVNVNAEQTFFRVLDKWNGAARIGFGGYNTPMLNLRYRSLPVGVVIYKGRNGHFKELGMHASYVRGYQRSVRWSPTDVYAKAIFLSPSVGYRFHKPAKSGIFLRFAYTPLIKIKEYTDDRSLRERVGDYGHMMSISVGYFLVPRHLRSKIPNTE